MSFNSEILVLPTIENRIIGKKYLKDEKIRIWDGRILRCEHNRRINNCKDCSGASICEHSTIRTQCRTCKGGSFCEHEKRRNVCVLCKGGSICEHNIRKDRCKKCENPTSICEHNIEKHRCKDCKGGSICEHNRERYRCKYCKGSSICEHEKRKCSCKICTPEGYLLERLRGRIRSSLKTYSEKKEKHTIEYLGCDLKTFREYFEKMFQDGMSWENQGTWHIDHRRPCASFDLSKEEERVMCFHYTNLQPLWGEENISKNDSYDEKTFEYVWNGVEWIKKS